MMQVKNTEAPKAKKNTKAPKANTLQKQFLALAPHEQAGVTNFFNLHNAAHYVYELLSEEAQKYITYCIRLSQNADKIEKNEESAQEL